MNQIIALIALVVADYDAAIAFYVGKLGFVLVEDSYQPEQDKRWVVVRPRGQGSTALLLAGVLAGPGTVRRQSGGRTRVPVFADR